MKSFNKVSLIIAADHAGVELMKELTYHFKDAEMLDIDCGKHSYPEVAQIAISEFLKTPGFGKSVFGVLICGSGIGISIAANRNNKIRAALCHTAEYAKLARAHNDANVLALGARMITLQDAISITQAFISTAFEGGRHISRVVLLG